MRRDVPVSFVGIFLRRAPCSPIGPFIEHVLELVEVADDDEEAESFDAIEFIESPRVGVWYGLVESELC